MFPGWPASQAETAAKGVQVSRGERQSWSRHAAQRAGGRVWQINDLQDIINRRKAKHKGKHLLLKEEGEKERQK